MNTFKTYKGNLNGIAGLWCGHLPEGVEVEEEITVYRPDEGKIFSKDGKLFFCVVLRDGVNIEDYQEIDMPEG